MRQFKVEEPIELNRNNDLVVSRLLKKLLDEKNKGNIIKTGSNASQTAGQEGYVELLAHQILLDPYSPYVYLSKDFSTPKKYVKAELDWYNSMDLSIIGHEAIDSNPT